MIIETIIAALVPVAAEGIKGAVGKWLGGVKATTIDEQVKLDASEIEKLKAIAALDTPGGVHNGTLKNKYKLPRHTEFDTDSEALYSYINTSGVHEAIKEVDGAYALVWYNKEEDTLNMLRNKERPLFYAYTEDRKKLFFASEPWMMGGVCWREGVTLGEIHSLPEDTLYTFNLSVTKDGVMGEAEVSPCKPIPFIPKPVTHIIPIRGQKTTSVGNNTKETSLVKKSKASSGTGSLNFGLLKGLKAVEHGRNDNGAAFVAFHHPEYTDIVYRLHKATTIECMEILEDKDFLLMT